MRKRHKPLGIYERYFKRLADIMCSLAILALFWWLYLLLAGMVRVKLGSPVLFIQERPGKNEKIFKLYKFRSMADARDSKGNLLPDDIRLGKFGKKLRATSLDELPEIFNILKGDMSIVGPRPLAVQYLPYYSEKEKHRHDVRPGLTGLAQVHGRNGLSWEEKFYFDLKYVRRITFAGDLKILLETIGTVLHRKNIGVRGTDSLIDFDQYRKMQKEGKHDC